MARKPRATRDKYPNRDLWKSDGRVIYELRNTGHDENRERAKDRCFGALLGAGNSFRFLDSKPWIDWKVATLLVDPDLPLDDMPWICSNAIVVSNKLRKVIESVAPAQAEYLPVRVKRAKWEMNLKTVEYEIEEEGSFIQFEEGEYWAMNTLMEVDCTRDQRQMRTMVMDLVIYSQDIPNDAVLFRDKNYGSLMFCRRILREACDEAGIRGPQFRNAKYE